MKTLYMQQSIKPFHELDFKLFVEDNFIFA
jgi:hypothetical protein